VRAVVAVAVAVVAVVVDGAVAVVAVACLLSSLERVSNFEVCEVTRFQ